MNQSPDSDQLNVGVREREAARMVPKFLPIVSETILSAWQHIPHLGMPIHLVTWMGTVIA